MKVKTNKHANLGVDFGRVIQGAALPSGKEDTVFLGGGLENALRSPATDGAIEVLAHLVRLLDNRVWIISKCGERVRQRTLAWLDHNDFYDLTGIPRENVRFCRKRPDKAKHCAELAITHMIDDHIEVHQALRGKVSHLYLFGHQQSPAPESVRHTPTWADVERAIIADIAVVPH